jgi:hypothetical protein
MFARIAYTAVCLIALTDSSIASDHCFQYGPAKVAVKGWIFERTDWGPPNYGDDPAHDSRERHDYIRLDKTLCVIGNPRSDSYDQTERNVKLMELAWQPEKMPFPPTIGRHASLCGTLFHGFDGHHHTRVLLSVTAVGPMGSQRKSN